MKEPNANYDEPWKEALEEYFEPFLEFFFPQVHALIDWSKLPNSLDKELQQITASSDSGLRFADKLYQVWRHNNQETWILIHIEVQSQEESEFAKRMYIYNYRAFDLYEKPVISLAILGDERSNWRPSSYGYTLGGCEVSLKYPIVKLLDYESQWQDLEASTNPFAVIAMAHLKTKATGGKSPEREQWKWSLVRGLYERGFERQEIIKLFQMIDKMMTLPTELQQKFNERLRRYEEDRKMPLLSNMELMAMEKATRQTLQSNIISLLQKRFETVPDELVKAINNIEDISELQRLHLETVSVNSVADFQQLLSQNPDIQEN
ncbi:transposase [Iningainema tapete]|uniref:Transposase n=1 Tax=Iningainema tapete BLCC-T55 TaxID=2748662 RepID=A0A8J7CGI5_9CYAN|nr:transposase [Iningainema tapete]MBD2776400.1 transposase [Iningainema tapete BLCC-T55]